jgi:FkbM family methyltransferase
MLKSLVGSALVPVARSYIRFVPGSFAKNWVFDHFAFRVHRARAGTVFGFVLSGSTADFLFRNVYYFGVWDPQLTDWIRRSLKPGDTFIDVGANIGYFSLLATRLVGPSGRVIAIEASPQICEMLRANIEANGVRNIEVHNCAVTDVPQRVTVYKSAESNLGLTTILPGKDGTTPESKVDGLPLNQIVDSATLARTRFIKIDVEGAEWMVLKGIEDYLRNDSPRDLEVSVEISPADLRGQNVEPGDVFDLFESSGFVGYRLKRAYFEPPYRGERALPRQVCPRELEKVTDLVFSRS